MAGIGHKLETKGVIMTLLSLVLIGTGCEDKIDSSVVNPSEGKTVEVTLNIGIADEEDGTGASASPTSKAGSSSYSGSAFEVVSVADVQTKSGTDIPDQLYNLEIWQYNESGNKIGGEALGNVTIGSTFTASLTLATGCKLLLDARGASTDFESLSGKTLSAVQDLKVEAKKSNINKIATNATGNGLANMTYYLLLENVNITSDGKIESPTGKDVRLLLKRLAVKVQLDWTFAQEMTNKGYTLKEVKLCQVPAHYRLVPQTEKTDKWGDVYPSSVAEFVDLYRLTGTELTDAKGTQTVWIPANARGISPYSNSPYYRNKTNANPAATYAEFVVDNSEKKERLYYRVYLGGNETDDFNLLENKNYHWTVNINNANYTNDPRIQLLDQTPVESSNLQPTSNCFMMRPGTNICFNPYKHEAGTNGWNTELTTGAIIQSQKTIDHVEVLWQTKDAGTSGDLVMGYVIDDNNHENLVNLTNGNDINSARIHVKVPVTNGGNAVIAAKNSSGTIVWSWHIWISDYVPVGLSGDITTINRNKAIEAAQNATQEGMVQVYGGISWTDPNGAFYRCVIMDRHLGAIRAGMQTNQLDGVRTFGLLYQGGRKDPFFSSADGTTNEAKTIYNGNGVEVSIDRSFSFTTYQQTIEHPLAFCRNDDAMANKPNAWNGDKAKTIYDPCPQGWRVPSSEYLNNANQTAGGYDQRDGDAKSALFAGFGFSNSSYVTAKTNSDDLLTPGNILYYDGTALHEMSEGKNKSSFPGSGYLYIGGSGESKENNSKKSAFFPGVSLREQASANYRANNSNNALYLWSSTQNNKPGNMPFLEFNQISADNTVAGKVNLCFQLNDHRIYGFSVRCIQDNIFDREPADYQADLKK